MWKDNLISNKRHVDFLRDNVLKGTLPHAMLFYGPEGSGQLVHALLAIQFLFCKNMSDHGPCGECSDCRKILHIGHPDVHFLFPTNGADALSQHFYHDWRDVLNQNPYLNAFQWMQTIAENKQGNINAKDCLHVYKKLNMQAYEGGKKVLVIWMAEYLGVDGNRLLKLIEEPPEDTHIILIAENRDVILPTIQSRCQQVYFKPYESHVVAKNLIDRLGIEENQANKIAHLSEGNYNEAVNSISSSEQDYWDEMSTWVRVCAKNDPTERVKWVEQVAKHSKEEQKQLLKYILQLMRKVLLLRSQKDIGVSEPELKMIQFVSQKVSQNEYPSFISAINDAILQIKRNANPKITWMYCTIMFRRALLGKKIEPIGVF